jgi:hypothetical protein
MHLTDEQLNEYLDDEIQDRVQIGLHISACEDCTARLTALKTLFSEIESLTEVELTHSIAARFVSTPDFTLHLPRWLTLTTSLQAVAASVAIIFAFPNVLKYLAPILQTYPVPSLNEAGVQLQMNFVIWMQTIQSFQFPTVPAGTFTLPKEFSSTVISFGLIGLFFIWAISNWWLLRKRPDFLA